MNSPDCIALASSPYSVSSSLRGMARHKLNMAGLNSYNLPDVVHGLNQAHPYTKAVARAVLEGEANVHDLVDVAHRMGGLEETQAALQDCDAVVVPNLEDSLTIRFSSMANRVSLAGVVQVTMAASLDKPTFFAGCDPFVHEDRNPSTYDQIVVNQAERLHPHPIPLKGTMEDIRAYANEELSGEKEI